MSNTSTLTPYDRQATEGTAIVGMTAACIAGVAAGTLAAARWLMAENPEDRLAVEGLKGDLRQERLRSARPESALCKQSDAAASITAVNLNFKELAPLVRAAESLGYRQVAPVDPAVPAAGRPETLLQGKSGERLVITRNDRGRLVLATAGSHLRLQSLVRRHTVDRALAHLKAKGMAVEVAGLASGEVQIMARERAPLAGGQAEIKAQVKADGTTQIDVDRVRGSRCETLVAELAEAVGAEVSGSQKKAAYFQLPGEPAKTDVKV